MISKPSEKDMKDIKDLEGIKNLKDVKDYHIDNFTMDLDELGIRLTGEQIGQFMNYYEMLVEWNSVMNLTTIIDFEEVMKKNFIDSLSIVKVFPLGQEGEVIDIGTGAGFPGIPIKIVYPHIKMTLLDSLNKRIHFLDQVVQRLHLNDVITLHGRAEEYARMKVYREKYGLCVSRAVAKLSTLSEYCLPYVKESGTFVSYKSGKAEDEVKVVGNALGRLGGKMVAPVTFNLPNSDIRRTLISIVKIGQTPDEFPRKAGHPLKRPL